MLSEALQMDDCSSADMSGNDDFNNNDKRGQSSVKEVKEVVSMADTFFPLSDNSSLCTDDCSLQKVDFKQISLEESFGKDGTGYDDSSEFSDDELELFPCEDDINTITQILLEDAKNSKNKFDCKETTAYNLIELLNENTEISKNNGNLETNAHLLIDLTDLNNGDGESCDVKDNSPAELANSRSKVFPRSFSNDHICAAAGILSSDREEDDGILSSLKGDTGIVLSKVGNDVALSHREVSDMSYALSNDAQFNIVQNADGLKLEEINTLNAFPSSSQHKIHVTSTPLPFNFSQHSFPVACVPYTHTSTSELLPCPLVSEELADSLEDASKSCDIESSAVITHDQKPSSVMCFENSLPPNNENVSVELAGSKKVERRFHFFSSDEKHKYSDAVFIFGSPSSNQMCPAGIKNDENMQSVCDADHEKSFVKSWGLNIDSEESCSSVLTPSPNTELALLSEGNVETIDESEWKSLSNVDSTPSLLDETKGSAPELCVPYQFSISHGSVVHEAADHSEQLANELAMTPASSDDTKLCASRVCSPVASLLPFVESEMLVEGTKCRAIRPVRVCEQSIDSLSCENVPSAKTCKLLEIPSEVIVSAESKVPSNLHSTAFELWVEPSETLLPIEHKQPLKSPSPEIVLPTEAEEKSETFSNIVCAVQSLQPSESSKLETVPFLESKQLLKNSSFEMVEYQQHQEKPRHELLPCAHVPFKSYSTVEMSLNDEQTFSELTKKVIEPAYLSKEVQSDSSKWSDLSHGVENSSVVADSSEDQDNSPSSVEVKAEGSRAIQNHQAPWSQPFISSDEAENADNFDPEWEALRRLESDEERYHALRRRWKNVAIPDPRKNLSAQNFRKRRQAELNGVVTPENTTTTSRKRTRSVMEDGFALPNPPKRRMLSCTQVYSDKINKLHQELNYEFAALQKQKKEAIDHMKSRQQSQLNEVFNSQVPRYVKQRRLQTLHNSQLQEMTRLNNQFRNRIQNTKQSKLHAMSLLRSACDEVFTFNKFYHNLANADTRDQLSITEDDAMKFKETEHMYDLYDDVYRG